MGPSGIRLEAVGERKRLIQGRRKSPAPSTEWLTPGLPEGSSADENLCSICQGVDFVSIFSGKVITGDEIMLGRLTDIRQKSDCAFCSLVVRIFRIRWGDETFEKMASGRPDVLPLTLELRVHSPSRDIGSWHLDVQPADSAEDFDLDRSFLCDRTPVIIVKPALGNRETSQSKQVDFGLFCSWISRCSNDHGPKCESLGARGIVQKPISLRVIDVQRLRVIPAPTECRYVALSYVWGTAKLLSTTKANLHTLEGDGSLQMWDGQLPQTIKDAIFLLTKLGERYLWVDSLCIVQDDAENKQQQISNMDRIYGSACWTLVAAAGGDANCGLPGLRPCYPIIQDTAVKGHQLALTLPDSYIPVDRSYWNSRAWTYQERFLSRKCLIFTTRLVYFQCASSGSCHDWQESAPGDWEEDIGYRGPFGMDRMEDEEPAGFWRYSDVLREYTSRQLTFKQDILNAFQGLSRVLSSSCGGMEYYWGLPEAFLDCGILWQPDTRLQRRLCTDPTMVFPSWSWVGWVGEVHHGFNPRIKDLQDEVEWYKYGADGIKRVDNRDSVRKCEMEPWQKREGLGEGGTIDEGPLVGGAGSNLTPRTHLLLLWTTSAHFSITGENLTADTRSSYRYQSFSIFDSTGSWCGSVEITDRDWADRLLEGTSVSTSSDWADNLTPKPDNNVLCEFIALSRRNDLMISMREMDFKRWDVGREWGTWNVMMVRRTGDDVAERVGLGKIHAGAWEKAGARAGWVMLG
ncbi:MAG: hypothetical protein M1813_004655 [Trichoglossum hirsutum]|nr:MAG: hypothetical protein M1813_004655 [Trichoglossum hirsutum]